MSVNISEKEIVVILPGLQYEKYGTLTIDKIEISATINNIPVQVYYLDTEESTGVTIKNAETLTLCKATEGVSIEGLYDNISYLGAIQEDGELRRAKTGSFFEIKNDNDNYTISVFNKELQYKNQSGTLHDGLCFVKVVNINSNIAFKVNFYSLLKYKEQDNTDVNNFTFVDTKTYYYNPLLNDLNLSAIKANPIQLKFSPSSKDDKEFNIKLSDNVIVFNDNDDKHSDKDYVRYIWENGEYTKTDQGFNNSDLTLCAWPQAFIDSDYFNWDTNKFKRNSYMHAVRQEPGRVVYSADTWCGALFPLYWKDPTTWTEKYKLQQDWFKKRTNVLGLTVDQLHDYGIYQTNFFQNIAWHNLTITHDNGTYEYMYGEKGICQIRDFAGRSDGWVYNIEGQEYVQGVPKDYMVYVIENADGHGKFMDRRPRIENDIVGLSNWFHQFLSAHTDTNPNVVQSKYFQYKMLVPDLQDTNNPLNVALQSEYTHYELLPVDGNRFDYLYKKSPYICLCNISALDPIQVKDDGLLAYFYHTTKNNNFQSPQNFIGARSSRIIDLNDSNAISWQWNIGNTICKSYKDGIIKDPNEISKDYYSTFGKNPSYINKMLNTKIYHTFPNFVLAVNLNDSNLKFKNLADYKVVPYVTIKHDNNPVGVYESALVESNVDDNNCLDLSTISTQHNSVGFFQFPSIMHYGHNNTLSWNGVKVPDSGYYVFSINGVKYKTYGTDYNTKLQFNINDKQCIIDINKGMHFLVFYLIKDVEYNISLSVIDSSYYNMLYLSSVGLYRLNLDADNIYNTYFKQSTQDIDTTVTQYIDYNEDLYKCVIFQGVYVYQEYQAKCYNKESNAVYPPEYAYQKPIGIYQVDNSNNTIISKQMHYNIKLLGFKGSSYNNSDCDRLIETVTVKQ